MELFIENRYLMICTVVNNMISTSKSTLSLNNSKILWRKVTKIRFAYEVL